MFLKKMETGMDFDKVLEAEADALGRIREAAHELHASVNQFYGDGLPYAYHLDGVAEGVARYGGEVCMQEEDVLPLMFGVWFHDSIEDARQTYNDTKKRALALGLDERQAFLAAEIVYALTNDKGRTRAERAGERYYAGIRATPYAPLVKLADRAANVRFSVRRNAEDSLHMAGVYRKEFPHFLTALRTDSDDVRLALPQGLVEQVCEDLGLEKRDFIPRP